MLRNERRYFSKEYCAVYKPSWRDERSPEMTKEMEIGDPICSTIGDNVCRKNNYKPIFAQKCLGYRRKARIITKLFVIHLGHFPSRAPFSLNVRTKSDLYHTDASDRVTTVARLGGSNTPLPTMSKTTLARLTIPLIVVPAFIAAVIIISATYQGSW